MTRSLTLNWRATMSTVLALKPMAADSVLAAKCTPPQVASALAAAEEPTPAMPAAEASSGKGRERLHDFFQAAIQYDMLKNLFISHLTIYIANLGAKQFIDPRHILKFFC